MRMRIPLSAPRREASFSPACIPAIMGPRDSSVSAKVLRISPRSSMPQAIFAALSANPCASRNSSDGQQPTVGREPAMRIAGAAILPSFESSPRTSSQWRTLRGNRSSLWRTRTIRIAHLEAAKQPVRSTNEPRRPASSNRKRFGFRQSCPTCRASARSSPTTARRCDGWTIWQAPCWTNWRRQNE